MTTRTTGRRRARTATGVLAALSLAGVGGVTAVAHASITADEASPTTAPASATPGTTTPGTTTPDSTVPSTTTPDTTVAPQQVAPPPQVAPGGSGPTDARSNGT